MLTNKEISETFEVQLNTLYNWKKNKPKLYKYLKNADYNFEQSKEINIVLNRFAKEIKATFTLDEILFFANSKIEIDSIEKIEKLENLFLILYHKELNKNSDFLLSIYNKIHYLNIVEKYILYKKLHNIRVEHKRFTKKLVQDYFSEFLLPN